MMPWLTVIDMREPSSKRDDILARLYAITAVHSEAHPKVSVPSLGCPRLF